MRVSITLEADAIRYERDASWVTDTGIVRVRKGQWCVQGEEFGPIVYSDEEFRERFTPCPSVSQSPCGPLSDEGSSKP